MSLRDALAVDDGPDKVDAINAPDGTGRVLVFRVWSGFDETNRRLGGAIAIIYSGPLLKRENLHSYIRNKHGLGAYKIIVQRAFLGTWRFIVAERVSFEP